VSASTAITIGTFDGVHHGHAALVHAARNAVGPSGRVVAMVFDPNPLSVLAPAKSPARLSTFDQRQLWLSAAGADSVIRLEPTRELLAQEPRAFIESIVREHRPSFIVEGPDFRFGRARAGDVMTLHSLGQSLGFSTIVVDPVEVALTDHRIVAARSTLVRQLVSTGRVRDAACVLGRPYELSGVVVRGDQRGRSIGFPTANVQSDQLLPANGVYAALAHAADQPPQPAAVNIGTRPTFPGAGPTVEVHIIRPGADQSWSPLPGLGEYGWPIRIEFVAWLRDEVRFESVAHLRAQLARDCGRAQVFAARAHELRLPCAELERSTA
jgi:riboflavin kinase/FMN adenylyltransferase